MTVRPLRGLLLRLCVLQADAVVVLVVLLSSGGQRGVGAAVEEARDDGDDEHLTDHHLLAQHWTTQVHTYINNKPTTKQLVIIIFK